MKLITVYYNMSVEAMFCGYQKGDILVKVWEGITDENDEFELIGRIFARLQANNACVYGAQPVLPRSMCTGDVVIIRDIQYGSQLAYAAEEIGWKEVSL